MKIKLNTLISIIVILISCNNLSSQFNIFYKNWNGSSYDDTLSFKSANVASDFGPRDFNDNWHGGIDMNGPGSPTSDAFDLIISHNSGTFVDINKVTHNANNNIRYPVVDFGDHRMLYVHAYFDNCTNGCNVNNNTVTALNMLFPNQTKWATVFIIGSDTIVKGQVIGKVLYNGDTLNVSNTVNVGDPIAPLGNSGTNNYHLHLNSIPDNLNLYSESWNANPLEYIKYDIPSYLLNLYSQYSNTVVMPKYPGNLNSSLALKVSLPNETYNSSDISYNTVMDCNKVVFGIKKLYESENDYTIIKGDTSIANISLGGKINENSYNHPVGSFGSWKKNGMDPFAYTTPSPRPWDIWYFVDFRTRIHKYDLLTPKNKTLLADTPINCLYNDGEYNIRGEAWNINDSIQYSEIENVVFDNFQPFITSFEIFDQDNNVYHLPRYQFEGSNTINNGYLKNGDMINKFQPSSNPFSYSLVINTSETLTSLSVGYDDEALYPPMLHYPNQTEMTRLNESGTVWGLNLPILEPVHYWFEFIGKDLAGNDQMNVYNMSNNNQSDELVNIPVRTGATTWGNTNTNHTIGNDFFEVELFCQRRISNLRQIPIGSDRTYSCTDLENIRSFANVNSTSCSVTIGLSNVDLTAFDIGWKNEDGNYEIGEETKEVYAPGFYCFVVESRDGCCYREGCIEVKNLLDIPDPELGYDCRGSYIDIGISPEEYTISWFEYNGLSYIPAPGYANMSRIYQLLPNKNYKYEVKKNNCVVETIATTGNEIFTELELGVPQISGTSCDLQNGSITFVGSALEGGAPPYYYSWSNGESTLSITDLGVGIYTLTVSDEFGCSLEKIYEISSAENYLISYSSTPSCRNSNNGSLEISVNELNGEYPTYEWGVPSINFEGSSILENIGPGEYCVTVTYENQNCEFVECFEVNVKDSEPLLIISELVKPCVNQNNGEIILTLSGGALPYSYNWSNGLNGTTYNKIENLSSGVYSVTISDGCGNSIDQTFLLESRNTTELEVDYEILPKNSYTQQISATVSRGIPPYAYNWKKYNSVLNEFVTVPGNVSIIEGELFPGKYILTVHDATKCFISYEIFECESAISIDYDLEIINLNDCEQKMVIQAKAINLVGNGDYKYLWNNISTSPEYIIPIDELNMFYEPTLEISDKCGFYKKLSKKIPCGEFCSNSCIIQKPTTTCFDECGSDLEGFICTKVKTFVGCEDNNLRELWPWWYGSFYNNYLGSNEQSIEFEDLEPRVAWAGQRAHFIINNKTTGCTTVNSFKFPPRCIRFVVWDWVNKKFLCPNCGIGGEFDDDSDVEDSGDEVFTYDCEGENSLMECEEEFSECVQRDDNTGQCYTWIFCYSTNEWCSKYIRQFECDEIPPGTECPEFIGKFYEKYPVEESILQCGNQLIDIDFANPDEGVFVFLKSVNNDSIHCERYNSDSTITRLFKISSLKNNALFSYGKSSFINIYEISSDTIGISKLNAIGTPISEIYIAGYLFVKYVKLSQDKFEIYVRDNITREYSVILFNKFNISNIASLDLNNSFQNEEISLIGTFDNINLNSIEALKNDSNITDYDSILNNINITYSSKIDYNKFALVGSLNKSISTNYYSFDSAQNILIIMNKANGVILVEPIGYFGELKINSIKKSANNILYLNGMEDIENQDTESCPFIYFKEICALSNCCEKLKPIIMMDTISCQISLLNFDSTATYSLFSDQNGMYVRVADSLEFPYSVVSLNNSSFYISATSASCEYVISDTLRSSCLDTIICPIMSSLYYTSPDSFIYFDLVLQDSAIINVVIQMSYYQGDSIRYIAYNNFIGEAGLNTFGVNIENLYPISYGYLSYWKFIVTYDSFPASCSILVDDWDWGPAIKNDNYDSRAIGINSVQVYPNPYTKGLVVDISSYTEQEIKLKIVNAIGQAVFSDDLPLGNGENRYICQECDNFPPGLYTVVLWDSSKKSILKKVVKF